MSTEIERRWLCSNIDVFHENCVLKNIENIKQIYIEGENNTVLRVRTSNFIMKSNTVYGYITVKSPSKESDFADEYEMEVPYRIANNLLINQKYLEKTRCHFLYEELKIYVDVFTSPKDLIISEIEFNSITAAEYFMVPDWFEKEITKDKSYSNSNLYKKICRLK